MKKLLRFTVNSTIAVLKIKLERNIHLGLCLYLNFYTPITYLVFHIVAVAPQGWAYSLL